jgi:hypothetical protein
MEIAKTTGRGGNLGTAGPKQFASSFLAQFLSVNLFTLFKLQLNIKIRRRPGSHKGLPRVYERGAHVVVPRP